MDSNGITPVMPINGMDGGFGGNAFVWIFGLLILLGLFNGGFGYGNNGVATNADVQRGFDAQNDMANQREILSAVNMQGAAGISATNQTFHDSLAAMQNLYNETQRDISDLRIGQAQALANQNECCCSTKQMIMSNNYDSALRDAATNASFTAQIQSVKDMLAQNKIEALQRQVDCLTLNNALAGVVRYPSTTTFSVPSTIFTEPTTTTAGA